MKMSKSTTKLSQAGRNPGSQSRTATAVCLMDSGGGKKLTDSTLHIAAYNCRSLLGDHQLTDLENEASKIKWDVIGLSEVRRKGEALITLPSGNTLFYKGHDTDCQRGVGFLLNRRLAPYASGFKELMTGWLILSSMLRPPTGLKLCRFMPLLPATPTTLWKPYMTLHSGSSLLHHGLLCVRSQLPP